MTSVATAPPSSVRALWPTTVARQVVALGALAALVSLVPGTLERGRRTLLDQLTGEVVRPVPHLGGWLGVTVGVGAAAGLLGIARGPRAARRVVAGQPRAATGVATLAALGVVGVGVVAVVATVLEVAPRTRYAVDVPLWVAAVLAALAVADLVLLVLAVVPGTRHWCADRAPAGPATPASAGPPFPPGDAHRVRPH